MAAFSIAVDSQTVEPEIEWGALKYGRLMRMKAERHL
jgi:hypothetical protein